MLAFSLVELLVTLYEVLTAGYLCFARYQSWEAKRLRQNGTSVILDSELTPATRSESLAARLLDLSPKENQAYYTRSPEDFISNCSLLHGAQVPGR